MSRNKYFFFIYSYINIFESVIKDAILKGHLPSRWDVYTVLRNKRLVAGEIVLNPNRFSNEKWE
jgi:hypothetical protein